MGFILLFKSKPGKIEEVIHIKVLAINEDYLKNGKANNGDKEIIPDMGSLGFYWSRAKSNRLPNPCAITYVGSPIEQHLLNKF